MQGKKIEQDRTFQQQQKGKDMAINVHTYLFIATKKREGPNSPLRRPHALLRLPDPLLLRPDHLLRLPAAVGAAVNVHGLLLALDGARDIASAGALVASGLAAAGAVHDGRGAAARAQLVDGADGVDGGVQRAARVEVLLDRRQQVLLAATGLGRVGRGVGDPRVRQRLVRRHALGGVDGQAALDELARRLRHAAPVLERRERVVGHQDGLHLLEVGVAVEWRVTAEEEVGDHTNSPDVAVFGLSASLLSKSGMPRETYTGLP